MRQTFILMYIDMIKTHAAHQQFQSFVATLFV